MKVSFSSLLELTLPNCSTRSSGCRPGLRRPRPRPDRADPRLELVPGDLELDQRRMPVGGHRRRRRSAATRRSSRPCACESRSVVCSIAAPELGIVDRQRLALHQDDLVVGPQPGVLERLLGAPDSPENWSAPWICFWPTALPTQDGDDHEPEPAEDRGLAVVALQCAARAARPLGGSAGGVVDEWGSVDIPSPLRASGLR